MATPSIDEIKKTTTKLEEFIQWLAEVLRGKNWVTKLLLLDAILFAFFNPLFLPTILKLFITEPKLPDKYVKIFWLVIGIIFIIALIVAILTKPKKTESPVIDLDTRSPIKGLRPFGMEDAKIFARLQRQTSIREFAESIAARDFRFGVLCGESGCGKTSFLQAGIIPRLKAHCQCVYVKFTDLDPLESIRQALSEQAQLPQTVAGGADLLALFEAAVQANNKPLVLFFDQFEQFFVHRKIKEQREPFIQALANWYQQRPASLVKIVISIRGDFKYRLDEFQKALGYSLGPHDSFTLEKFTPAEAAEIFRVIAEAEGISCDADFIKELAQQQLAHEDGLISPVDIQILAWMIWGQKTEEERAFNRQAFQQLGGIEGLLERYLSRVLEARETEERRQNAIKVLLALTDLERNVRAGVLTIAILKQKLTDSVPESELVETVHWLARGDIRLITPNKLGTEEGYELAHERLIPALRKITGKVLSQVDQANQLLNRRVNEWLGNDKDSRYLLRWRELRKINRQKNFLTWGENEAAKKALIAQSSKRNKMQAALMLCLVLCLVSSLFITKIIHAWQREHRIRMLDLEFVDIKGGTFEMGKPWGEGDYDEPPVHKVKLSDFKMSKYEITNQQYCLFLNASDKSGLRFEYWIDTSNCKIKRKNGQFVVDPGYEQHPIVTVNWHGADNFAKWLQVRLPREAEWEYAARGGEKSQGYRYSGSDNLDSVAWHYGNSGGEPHRVGTKNPNELGLYDMSGNVWEWCNDWFSSNYYDQCYEWGIVKDPIGPKQGIYRVVRGGSWGGDDVNLYRCANRLDHPPAYRDYDLGFRLVRSAQL